MSSTNRGRNKVDFSYYITPIPTIEHFINIWNKEHHINNLSILDPCCGGDSNNKASYLEVLNKFKYKKLDSIDIREDSHANIKTNFLTYNVEEKYDLIISNPPFDYAMEFINKGLSLITDGGYLIYFLRLNFFGSKSRNEFFKKRMPEFCYVHPNRPKFIPGLNQTDSIEYAHFVWSSNKKCEYTKLYVLDYI